VSEGAPIQVIESANQLGEKLPHFRVRALFLSGNWRDQQAERYSEMRRVRISPEYNGRGLRPILRICSVPKYA
jgi:hypothetical protein